MVATTILRKCTTMQMRLAVEIVRSNLSSKVFIIAVANRVCHFTLPTWVSQLYYQCAAWSLTVELHLSLRY